MLFSPITEKSFAFIESCVLEKLNPILIISPSKKNFGISLSARILKKYWLDDLNGKSIKIEKGDIVKIEIPPNIISKNRICLYVKVTSNLNNKIFIKFEEPNTTTLGINSNWVNKYGKVVEKRNDLTSLNKFLSVINKLNKVDSFNNPTSLFLGNDNLFSLSQLSSKVFLIVGRGNVEESRYYIQSLGLKDAINEGLIIKESLRDFADILVNNQVSQTEISFFIEAFKDLFDPDYDLEEDTLNQTLRSIQVELLNGEINMAELRSLLDKFTKELQFNGYYDELQSLLNLIRQFLSNIPLNNFDISFVKSVLIDGTELATTYANTISALLNLKIPVIILSDYANYTNERKEKINNISRDFPNAFRLNWDKPKINSFEEIATDIQYLDKEAYNFCKKYLNQRVTIEAFNDDTNIIDKFFNAFEIRGLLRRIDGFEGIKNAYTIHLRPIVYWVKNIPGPIEITKDIIEAVNSFQKNYDLIRSLLNAQQTDVVNLLDEFLALFINEEGAIYNSKTIDNLPEHSKYFNHSYDRLPENDLLLTNYQFENTEIRTLVFTGTPYEEVKQRYLRKAIFEDFDNIYFLGFCKEAENVYQRFINDTISYNGRIHDSLPVNFFPFWEPIVGLEPGVTYLNKRCSEYKNEAEPINEDIDFDEVQDLIELARYQVNDRDDSSDGYTDKDTKVLVNILELYGNKSVFIKKTGARKLLVLKKNKNFDKSDWDEINPGDRVFTYVITRHDTLEMRGENRIDEFVFNDLDIWYKKLKEMWESFNESFIDLAENLNKFKIEKNLLNSNPELSNIRNWLHKERIINAPEKDNLKLILLAAGTSNINDVSEKIMIAKRKIEKFDRKNRDDIKKQIEKYINEHDIEESDEFRVIVNTVPILVKHGVVKHKMETIHLKMEQDKIGIILKIG